MQPDFTGSKNILKFVYCFVNPVLDNEKVLKILPIIFTVKIINILFLRGFCVLLL